MTQIKKPFNQMPLILGGNYNGYKYKRFDSLMCHIFLHHSTFYIHRYKLEYDSGLNRNL